MTNDEAAGSVRRIRDEADVLAGAAACWAGRTDERPPAQRRAASEAIAAADAILREVYALRGYLADTVRASDDATAQRVDAMLERARRERTGQPDQDGSRAGS